MATTVGLGLRVRVTQVVTAKWMKVRTVRRIWHGMWIEKAAGVRSGTKRSTVRRRHRRTVHIHSGVLLFPLGATVLKPDFHLRNGKKGVDMDLELFELLVFWDVRYRTCVSVRLKLRARFSLSQTDRYRVVLNLFSRETNCS